MKTRKSQKQKEHYDVHYLALALVVFLLLEVTLFSITSQTDWQAGMAMLDVSSSVSTAASDLGQLLQPVADTISAVNLFYNSAATAMTELLDFSDLNIFEPAQLVFDGVSDFYQQASTAMASMLDASDLNGPVVIAGTHISSY